MKNVSDVYFLKRHIAQLLISFQLR